MENSDEVQRFSPHLAKLLMQKSPYHAWCDAYKLGNRPRREPSAAMIKGRLIDRLVFGVGDTVRIRQPKERANQQHGEIVVLQSEYDAAKECADSVLFWCKENGIDLTVGFAQPKWIWKRDNGVVCSGRPDHFDPYTARIIDLKTTWDLSDRALEYKFRDDWAYQAGAYLDAVLASSNASSSILFIAAESGEPYDVRKVELSPAMVDYAKKTWDRACRVWKECLEKDEWPAYGNLTLSARGEGLGAFGDAVAFDSRSDKNPNEGE